MEFVTFKQLPQPQQLAYLRQQGRFLTEHQQDSFSLSLYACHNYFAEVWRSRGEEAVLFIHVFQNVECLIPYLEKIILPGA